MASTRVARHIRASRSTIYRALLDPELIAQWRFPDGMDCVVHHLDARQGGSFRVTLSYDGETAAGKSSPHTDTYGGHFASLTPDREVVETIEFETADPELQGEMTMTTTLADSDGGTEVVIAHQGIPSGVSEHDNEVGTRMALDKLAALVESVGQIER